MEPAAEFTEANNHRQSANAMAFEGTNQQAVSGINLTNVNAQQKSEGAANQSLVDEIE